MIIAIDGPAGAGKGTIARYLAQKLSLAYLDTGLLFRAVAYAIIQEKIDPFQIEQVVAITKTISLKDIDNPLLRGEDVASIASKIAVIPLVRTLLIQQQRNFAQRFSEPYRGAILDGRDIGTVVLPEAPCKLFITARLEVRVARRLEELQKFSSSPISGSSLEKDIRTRDNRDSNREESPLLAAPDAYLIDTSDLTIEQACAKAASYVIKNCFNE